VAASFVVLAGAVGALTWGVLRYDAAERDTRRRAEHEAAARLALWRMDAAVQPILVLEAARPVWHYRSLDPALPGPPSPLAVALPDYALLHAELAASGALSSPQAMSDQRAAELGLSPEVARAARQRLEALRPALSRETLIAALDQAAMDDEAITGASRAEPARPSWLVQNDVEYANRFANVEAAYAPAEVAAGRMTATWLDDRLLMVRSGGGSIQVIWLDWQRLRERLAASVSDLLPQAEVVATTGSDARGRRLASLPATVMPGPAPPAPARAAALWLLLGIAWAGAALAMASVAGLTLGAVRLGQRRAEFASAVTHELRTPMTTLCTYTEMLAEGRVNEPGRRQRYLDTLQREATRLAHLIENVLAWSGVERGRAGLACEELDAGEVIDRHRSRLAERAEAAGMSLAIAVDRPLGFEGDEVAVGQILFNLVDNACKYAAGGEPEIELSVTRRGPDVVFAVRDHGPGIAADERRRIFEPFHKSDARAAGQAPGVGLGLALSRRLARAMGGDLVLAGDQPGTSFELRLRAR
jgi:signal transduction histidine kinase